MSRQIINTEKAPAAIGPYSQAVRAGNTVYFSGQIPLDPATGDIVGAGDVEAQARRAFDNLKAVAEAAGEPVPVAAQDTARDTLTQDGSALKASMLRDLEAGQQVEAEQIVGDMLARARKADQEALLLQVAYSSLQAYQALRGA